MTNTSRMVIDQPHTEVFVSESGHITIQQECPMQDEQYVVIHPLFVPTLIAWLQQLAEELKNAQSNS